MVLPPQITPMTCSLTRKMIVVILQSHSLVLFVLREDLWCFCILGAGSCSKCISEALSAIILMDTKSFSSLTELGNPLVYLELKSHWCQNPTEEQIWFVSTLNLCSRQTQVQQKWDSPSNTPKFFRKLCLFPIRQRWSWEKSKHVSVPSPKRERDCTGFPEELKIRI